jgi:preprotein translocase subunit SecD
MKPRNALLIIFVLTIISALIDLPDNVPLKFSIGPVHVNRLISSPQIDIPALKINKNFTTQLGLDLQGGVQLVLEADMRGIAEAQKTQALESARQVLERRVNFFGVSEPQIQTAQVGGSYRIIVELPGLKDAKQAVETVGQTAKLEFREAKTSTVAAFFYTPQNTLATGLTGKDLKSANVDFDQRTGQPVVAFEMTTEGAKKFGDLTTRLVGKPLVIFLDDTLVSAPTVNTPITEGRGTISGSFTKVQAQSLALTLSAGALPVPIKIIQDRTIGATLGSDSVKKSITAGILGLSLVAVYMIIYYGWLGFIADVALIIYGLITFAIFRAVPLTLTLAGIAGFILSIGMAVDSNILIFARLKEEQLKGKPLGIAMELAFGRAWTSIKDANFTTIMTAIVLYNPLNLDFIPVSGIVRGFAITLGIGVLVSLFTGIFVTRNLMRLFYHKNLKV